MIEQIQTSISYFLPEIALAATFVVAILTDLIFKRKPVAVALVAIAGLLAAAVFVCLELNVRVSIFSGMYVIDPFSVYFKFVVIATALLIVLFSLGSKELTLLPRRLGEYYSLLVAMSLGMVLMTGASNLLMMYLALELTSLSSYIVAGFTKEAPDSSEASLKYVIYGALSSGLMLYGFSILFGLTGTLNIYEMNRALLGIPPLNWFALLIAGILALAGFGYKISAVPFHFWTPDVYEGAPVTITAFLSVASKAGGFAMLMRFLKVTFIDIAASAQLASGIWATLSGINWQVVLAILSVATMTLGNLVAIWQTNLKRLLAYSSIAHAGYMLMGLVVLSNEGYAAVLVYFVAYLLMNLGAFYVVMIVANQTGSESIEEYRGLGYRSPLLAVGMTIFLFSLTGIPPTFGFIGKLYLFAALIHQKVIWLAAVGVINSVISLYYYMRIVRNMFLRDVVEEQAPLIVSPSLAILLLVLVIPTLLLFLYFGPLVTIAQASVSMFGMP
jgi:NADH-quinone oxidoreductase subunit N